MRCRIETVDHTKCGRTFCAADPAGDIADHKVLIVRCQNEAVSLNDYMVPVCVEHAKVLG